MNIDDLGRYDPENPTHWIPMDPGDVMYVSVAMQILIPIQGQEGGSRSVEDWVRHYMDSALDLRVNVLGPGEAAKVCERGHVVPEHALGTIPAYPGDNETPPQPEMEACEDCADEAVAWAERHYER
jgi:hypothetical protein